MTSERRAKVRELIHELELSIELSKRKHAVLSDTITATASLMQEATQRRAELELQNQMFRAMLRQLAAAGVELPECAQLALAGSEASSLTPELTGVVDFLAQDMLAGSAAQAHVLRPEVPAGADSQSYRRRTQIPPREDSQSDATSAPSTDGDGAARQQPEQVFCGQSAGRDQIHGPPLNRREPAYSGTAAQTECRRWSCCD